jgi:uncharacterized protein
VSAYLDASALLPRLIEELESDAIAAWLPAQKRELLVSDFAVAEVASGVSRLVRMRLLSADEAVVRLDEFEIWRAATTSPVDLHASDARLACLFVRRFELMLCASDAVHLAIARRLDATLVTLDRRLSRAAEALDIAVEMPRLS